MSHSKPQIISIEGNIGAGKTTTLPGVLVLKEPVDEWMEVKDSAGKNILELEEGRRIGV